VVTDTKENRPTPPPDDGTSESVMKDKGKIMDWRQAIAECLKDPGGTKDKKIHRQAIKYVLMDGNLYRRTVDGLLLKRFGVEQSRIAMGEVHEGLCGTHQSAFKMKWAL
jgi:hypothetical protein